MKLAGELTDDELKGELSTYGFNAGPITGTTRGVLQKKLEAFRTGSKSISKPKSSEKRIKAAEQKATEGSPRTPLKPQPQKQQQEYDKSLNLGFSRQRRSLLNSTIGSEESQRFIRNGFDNSADSSKISSTSFEPRSRRSFAPETSFLQNGFDEDNDDDHMESSRILSPRNRFYPSSSSRYSSAKPFTFGGQTRNYSPVDRIKNMGKSAWGFFSRPIGTSTPCSDTNVDFMTSPKYRKYAPDHNISSISNKKPFLTSDVSRYIWIGFYAFLAIIFATYICRAHPEAVQQGSVQIRDFLRNLFYFLYNYAIVPIAVALIIGLIVGAIYQFYAFRRRRKDEAKNRQMQLVERITDIIFESGSTGVAEPHVRDMIMPPTKRTESDYSLWKQASNFINNEDSRIRTEIRLIGGTECNVWIWTGVGKQRWQGTAVAEDSPSARVPERALAHCLKLRGLSFTEDVDDQDRLRLELFSKLDPIVPKHIGFHNGAENIVYMKLKNLDDAKKAFTAFHSHWFNGNLIMAKYVRDERYRERYPDE